MRLPGFDLIGELSSNGWHVLYRARRREDQGLVLIKAPRHQTPLMLSNVLLEHELGMLRQVTAPGLLRTRDLTHWGAFDSRGGWPVPGSTNSGGSAPKRLGRFHH